ncbi:MAG: hypothetical protein JST82_05880 [Bacteroidetes bacterium]|nr:hypothetical protein [Bacteroidota bacterium]
MNIKSISICLLGLTLSISASAQDKIYKRNGGVIDGKVQEVTSKNVSYKKADNPEGPTYVIEKSALDRIEYQNGSEDVFKEERHGRETEDRPARKENKIKYGNNVLAVAPLQLTENGIGVGLTYERVLDKKGIISFYMPAIVSFSYDNSGNTPVPMTSTGPTYYNNNGTPFYYVMPGLKIYPTGSKGKVRYAVGPNIVLMSGQQHVSYFVYDNYGNPIQLVDANKNQFALGVMVNNSLNMNPTKHLYLGLELGLGVSYMNQVDGINQGEYGFTQFAFKMGYRF